jgi:regulator of protease activity HflC (stomatin/prohibitin superfamily)
MLRLILFVATLLLWGFLVYLFNGLLFEPEIRWPWVVLGVLPGAIALLGVIVMGGAFEATVFGLESWRRGMGHALLCLFGRPWPIPYPFAIVSGGSIREGDRGKFVADRRLGGPGKLVIFTDSAVVLERHGRITRVEGPRIIFVERFERVREILDLRPQTRTVSDAVTYTKDGIAVKTDITVRFQIRRGGPGSEEQPYPPDQAALEAAARSKLVLVSPPEPRSRFNWQQRVMGNVESSLRGIVAGRTFDELFEPADVNKDPRDEIGREMVRLLREQSANLGVDVLEVMLGPLKPVEASVEQQRLASWLTAQRAQDRVREAEGEAQALLARETAYAYAQLEMMLAIDQGFRELVKQDQSFPSYFIALRFVETLRRVAGGPGIGLFLPKEAIQTLEFLNNSLLAPPSKSTSSLPASKAAASRRK